MLQSLRYIVALHVHVLLLRAHIQQWGRLPTILVNAQPDCNSQYRHVNCLTHTIIHTSHKVQQKY